MGEYSPLKLGMRFSVSPKSVFRYNKCLVSLEVRALQVLVAVEHVPPAPQKVGVSSQAACDLASV